MGEDKRVDELLDQWDEVILQTPQADLDLFVRQHCRDLDGKLQAHFRNKATALAKMNRRLEALQDTSNLSSNTSQSFQSVDTLKILEPGYEPIDGYKLVQRLGRGGFGEVWKATDARGFSVAIKFVDLSGPRNTTEFSSLDVIKDVRHPHLSSIFHAQLRNDTLIIAMELADRTLLDRLEEAKKEGYDGVPQDELFEYMTEAAQGIDFLNEPGLSGRPRIQHCDIKPANLLLSGNSVKIADFGLAQALTFNVAESTGSTPAYAAPEFLDGNTTSTSDQYSLAITYCYLRGGFVPFEGTLVELMDAHRNHQPELDVLPLRERWAVARALSKKPKDRWSNCAEFVNALKLSTTRSSSKSSDNLPATKSVLNQLSRRTKLVIGAVAGMLVLALILFILFKGNDTGLDQSPGALQSPLKVKGGDSEQVLTLAVIDFTNHTRDPILDGYRLGFRDMLTTDLSKLSSIKVLERARLESLLWEQDLAKTEFIDPKTAVRLGRGLSAHAMLGGSYVISGDSIRVDVRLVSVETGEVMMADSVEGDKSDLFGLQKTLAKKVLLGLKITPTESEQAVLNQPQTRQFEAFRLYSEARIAQLRGNQSEAENRLREALAKDKDFQMAARELDRLETDALVRESKFEQHRVKLAEKTGQLLAEQVKTYREFIKADCRDPAYFAGLLIFSAHAGLMGNPDLERKLLIKFWRHFEQSISPNDCLDFSKDLHDLTLKEGEFFQEHLDSGDYETFSLLKKKPEDKYLKHELRGSLQWPKWSAMWPFDERLRSSFHFSQREQPSGFQSSQFNEKLPFYPDAYLKNVIANSPSVSAREDDSQFYESLHLLISIVRYYARITDKSKSFDERVDVDSLHSILLYRLRAIKHEQMKAEILREAIPVLEFLSESGTNPDHRSDANTILVRFVQHLRIDEDIQNGAPAKKGPLDFCGLQLSGSQIIFVWQVPRHRGATSVYYRRVEKSVRTSLADAVRIMHNQTYFNIQWAGHVKKDKLYSVFTTCEPATNEAKKKGLDWLYQKAHLSYEESIPIEKEIERLADEFDDKTDVVLIALDKDPELAQNTVDFVSRGKPIPRFYVVSSKKHPTFVELVSTSKGEGVTLKTEGGLIDTNNVEIERWSTTGDD